MAFDLRDDLVQTRQKLVISGRDSSDSVLVGFLPVWRRFTDNDLNRLNLSAAGFAHADSADLFGDVVLGADNVERTAAADGTDQSAVASGAFVVAIESVSQFAHCSPSPL